MKKAIRYITIALFIVGLIISFWAVGVSDEYIINLSQDPPQIASAAMWVGGAMMLPALVRVIVADEL